jgi:hypothetical protein
MWGQRRWWPLVVVLLVLAPAGAVAQLPVFVSGAAGGAFTTDENTPEGTSSGFAWQGQAGLRLAHIAFGGEVASYNTGSHSKSKIYGGFVRFPTYLGASRSQIYLTIGLGAYQFDPDGASSSTTVGGSIGPGVSLALGSLPFAVMAEARFHSTFDKLPRINSQQYLGVIGGLEFRF